MPKQERSEDLNPHNDDIEEKIKRMLDPRLPDDITGESGKQPVSHIKIVSDGVADYDTGSNKTTQSKPDKDIGSLPPSGVTNLDAKKPAASLGPKTAPELPDATAENASDEPQKGRKVITPISHEENTATEDGAGDSVAPEGQPRKITVADHDENTEDLAEKLDKTIAELDDGGQTEPTEDAGADDKALAPLGAADDEPESDSKEETDVENQAKEQPQPSENETKTTTVKKTETVKEKPAKKPKDEKKKAKVIDDPETDKAVKDIVSKESDKLLAAEDKKREERNKPKKKKKSRLKKILTSKPLRWLLLLLMLAAVGALIVIPEYRYRLLNAVGVRASSSVTVRDVTTGQPIKNVTVRIGDSSALTNDEGTAELNELLLGSTTLAIEKVAYATVAESITVGWGSNPLGERSLTPTGVQYQLSVADFVSGAGIEGAQAAYQASNASADADGLIRLTVPDAGGGEITITISAEGYLDKDVVVPAATDEPTEVALVPNRKHVFVSTRSGQYDIYSSYIDGSKESRLLEASGYEQDDLVLLPHPSINRAAYVSTRTNNRNDQGNLTYNLLLLNLDDNSTSNVVAADKIQLLGWSGESIVYITTNTSDDSGQRSKLFSYNASNGATTELSASNYFNDVLLAGDLVYYAPTSLVGGGDEAKLYSRRVNGEEKRTIVDQEVWKLFRNNYRELAISAQNQWFSHTIGSQKASDKEDVPSNRTTRHYIENPNGKQAVWVDQRDGKGTLLLYDTETNKDTTLLAKNGIKEPIFWLNDTTIIFRVENNNETADYVMSTRGGAPIKITDVSATGSTENWYYF